MATLTSTETPVSYDLRDTTYDASIDQDPLNDTAAKPTRTEILRILSASFAFFVAGVNDGSFGALVPLVIRDYGITTAIVSSVQVTDPANSLLSSSIP